jgi:hypothetical protein
MSFGLSEVQRRAGEFFAPLPLSLHQIYIARVAIMLAMLWLPVAVVGVVCAAAGVGNPLGFIAVAAFATPVALAMQSLVIHGRRIPISILLSALGFLSIVVAAEMLSPAFTWHFPVGPAAAISLIIAAAIFFKTCTAPLAVRASATRSPALPRAQAIRIPRFPWWLLTWRDVFWFGALFVMTFAGPWTSSMMLLWAYPVQGDERKRWLDSFPIDRRIILATRVLPSLAALACGYLVGSSFGFAGQFQSRHVEMTAQCGAYNVTPPLEDWVLVGRGRTSTIQQAPWGETFQPPVTGIYGFDIYNPYSVGCGNTTRYSDWQYHRALAAKPHLRMRLLNVGAILTLALFASFPLVLANWWRLRREPRLRAIVVGLMFAISLGIVIVTIFHPVNALQLVSWALPNSLLAVDAVAIAVPVALYVLLQKVFLQSEFVGPLRPAVAATGNYT